MRQTASKLLSFGLLFFTRGVTAADYIQSQIQIFQKMAEKSAAPLQVTLVAPKSLESQMPRLIETTREAIDIAGLRDAVSMPDDFAIFFDTRPDDHNGMTTVVPTNRISVNTEAPDLESSIGFSRDYLLETLVHELGHMHSIQQRAGIFTVSDAIFGNISRPISVWPRWMLEGYAVWTEGAIGGRPESGYIAFDLRKYADAYSRRNKVHPLQNSDLDGWRPVRKVETGEIPYHFGYLLIKAYADQSGEKFQLRKFIQEASHDLGLSFRLLFRKLGVNLDKLFNEQREKWAATPLLAELKGEEIASKDRISGPYAFSFSGHEGISWIETADTPPPSDRGVLHAKIDSKTSIESPWTYSFTRPLKNILISPDRWLVLYRANIKSLPGPFYDPSLSARKFAGIFDLDGHRLCKIDLPSRLREISYAAGLLSWIRSTDEGHSFAEKASLDEHCALGKISLLAQSRYPFERLSSIYADANNYTLSRMVKDTGFAQETLEWNGKLLRAPYALSIAFPYKNGLLASEYSKEHWGPVFIENKGDQALIHRMPMRTGSFRSAVLSDSSKIIFKEALWEKDRIVSVSADTFSKKTYEAHWEDVQPLKPVDYPAATKIENYGPWPSIWPHFWLPSALIETGGFMVMGETFYNDLTGDWAGDTVAGYDSVLQRPFFNSSLSKSALSWGPFSQMAGSVFFSPVYNYSSITAPAQNRWGAEAHLVASYLLPGLNWTGEVKPGLLYLQASSADELNPFIYFVPGLTLSLTSHYGQRASSPFFHLSDVHAGFAVDERVRMYAAPEIYSSIQAELPLYRTGFYFQVEHGLTSQANYPASFFEWGGLPVFATGPVSFMTRGFPWRAGDAQSVFRADVEWGFPLPILQHVLSWDRLRIANTDAKLIAESVTFNQFYGDYFQLFRQYFTSVGTEVDLWGSAIHYINYKITLGFYRGFGPYGQYEFALGVRNALDL